MDDVIRLQIEKQCLVVASLAESLALVHRDKARLFAHHPKAVDRLEDIVGNQTSAFMESLGNMLNAMDACTEEDDWMTPIFHEAQKRWPNKD